MEQKSNSVRNLLRGSFLLLISIILFISGLVNFVLQTELFRPRDTDFVLSGGLCVLAITGLGIFFEKWGKL